MDEQVKADFKLIGAAIRGMPAEKAALLRIWNLLKPPDDDQVGRYRRRPKTSRTSRKAALERLPGSGTQRMTVLAAIVQAGGLADEQGEDLLRLSGDSYRPRRDELHDGGWVMISDRTYRTRAGHDAEVWIATPKALAAFDGGS